MHTSTQWKKTILQYISSISSIIHQVQFSDDTNGSKSYIQTEVLVCYDTTTIIIINRCPMNRQPDKVVTVGTVGK